MILDGFPSLLKYQNMLNGSSLLQSECAFADLQMARYFSIHR